MNKRRLKTGSTMLHKGFSLLMTVVLVLSIMSVSGLNFYAANPVLFWRQNDSMDKNLNIDSGVGDNELLFQMGIEEVGDYTLTYYLEDDLRTTVSFYTDLNSLSIKYKIEEYDPGDPGNPIQRTQDLITGANGSLFSEIDYTEANPDWQVVEDDPGDPIVDPVTHTIDYTIIKSPSAVYSGYALDVAGRRLIIKWDFEEELLSVEIDNYQLGYIMPVTFDRPDGVSKTVKVLKGLEDFSIEPMHLVPEGGVNVEPNPISHPDFYNVKLGDKPGIRIKFKQPREVDTTTWSYIDESNPTPPNNTDLSDIRAWFRFTNISEPKAFDINIMLQNATGTSDKRIYELPTENGDQTDPANHVYYSYTDYEYEILVVQDKSPLNNPELIVEWNKLESSRIYNSEVEFESTILSTEYEFTNLIPENNFVYTYLEYELDRINKEEAYLEIKPYNTGAEDVEYLILRSLSFKENLDNINDFFTSHFESNSDNVDIIRIPVPGEFSQDTSQEVYQVVVNYSGNELRSQTMKYVPKEDSNVPPAPPIIEAIDRLYVVPPEDSSSDNPSKIQFDLVWSAISNLVSGELDEIFSDPNNNVYYEILINDTPDLGNQMPDANPESGFQVFRVYEMYKDPGDGKYKLRVDSRTTATDTIRDISGYEGSYHDQDESIRVDNIVIYEDDLRTNLIEAIYDDTLHTYDVVERNSVSHPGDFETDILIPGVNYIRMRVITEINGVYNASEYSTPASLTLNVIEREIPIVEGISYEPFYSINPVDPMGVTMEFPKIDITPYYEYMLAPLGKTVDDIQYHIYLSEDKNSLLEIDSDDSIYIQENTEIDGSVEIDEANLQLLRDEDINGDGNILVFTLDDSDYVDNDQIDDVSVRIEGLDLNNTYFSRIIVKVTIGETPVVVPAEVRRGKASTIVAITTPIVPPEPGPDEILPVAPEGVVVSYLDETKLATTITWNVPDEISVKEDVHGFEVLSIESRRLPEDIDSRDFDVTDIIGNTLLEGNKAEAWRIYEEGGALVLTKYNEDTDSWDVMPSEYLEDLNGTIRITDNDNAPNRVLYYYVRTIQVKDTEDLTRSGWIEGTITTAPVRGPINLIIDYNSDFTKSPNYDPGTQTIIRFDAPLSDIADVNSLYYMEIFVKGESDPDYVECELYYSGIDDKTYAAELLGEDEFSPVGYKRIYFKVYGLIPGKQYEIKVRIEDRTKDQEELKDGTLVYPVSPFSDKVTTRTEFSQEDYDKELKYKQYIDYYLEKAEELTQKPYYQLATTDNKTTAKYRLNYADGLVRINGGGTYELEVFDKEATIYYMPSGLIQTANDYNVTYVLEPSNQSVAIHPFSLGNDITDEINQVIDDINAYDSVLEDYYVKVMVSVGQYTGTIQGQEPSSPLINIQMSVVGSKLDEEAMDFRLETEIDRIVGLKKNDLILLLEQELEKGIDDVKLTRIVQTVLADVQEDFYTSGQQTFEDQLDNVSYEIKSLAKNLTVGISADEPDGSNILYSKTTGDWEVEESSYYNLMYHVESMDLGSFMSVKRSGSEELGQIYTSEQLELLNRYTLTDVFTDYELKTPDTVIYNQQMIRTLSRLLGAASLDDNKDYLKDHGVHVPYFNDYSSLNRELANYLYVQVYALKNQINLDAVVIRDYNQIEDIHLINPDYHNTLLKGVSLSIIDLEQGQLMPNEQVTLQDFFRLVDNIE